MPLVSFRSRSGVTGADRVVRDRMTITLYGSYAVWGWFLYSFNPSVPLLAADQGISAALAGLHGTAMAAGGLGAAFLAPRAVLAWGRRRAIVASCGAVVVGVTGLVAGPSLPWTLSAMVVLAAGGNVLISSAQVGLALHHGRRASAVITEGNGTGSGIGLLGPLAVGATLSLGWGWRPAVLVTAPLAIAVAVLVGRLPATSILTGRRAAPDAGTALDAGPAPDAGAAVPDLAPAPVPHEPRWRPGRPAVLFLLGIVAAVAVENATTFWSTALLIERTGAGPGIATAATAGLVAGMTTIRFVVGPLSMRIAPARLLAAGFAVSIAGWAVLWTTQSTGVALVGLVLAGLGLGVQYPLSIALLLAASPGHSDRAQGGATLVGSLSIAVAPFLLGAVSDHVGMHTAFVLVPMFALVGALAAAAGGRALRRVAVVG